MENDQYASDPIERLDLSTVTAGLVLSGRYRLEALLAFSRNVMTWRAVDQVLSRPVLIHLLEADDERLGWVLQAARRAATVADPRFLRVLDAQEASGQEQWSVVVCEFPAGDSLKTLLAAGPLTGQQAAFIMHEVAAALAPQHARGMFHLRLTPDAVVVTPNGNVKIAGFLIDAALRPEPGDDQLSWAQQEAIDATALGHLLYAATTAHWPVPPNRPQRQVWGLPPAPLADESGAAGTANEQVWPTPHELNRQIDPEISSIAVAAMRPGLGLVGPSLHTAKDIAESLAAVAPPTGAEESLEALVRENRGMAATPATPAVLRSLAGWDDHPTVMLDATPATQTAPDHPAVSSGATAVPPTQTAPDHPAVPEGPLTEGWDPVAGFEATPVRPLVAGTRAGASPAKPSSPTAVPATAAGFGATPTTHPAGGATTQSSAAAQTSTSERARPVAAPPPQRPGRSGGSTLGRRGIWLLIGFVVVSLLVLQIRACGDQTDGATGPAEDTSVVIEPVEIASAFDFDPVADGGDQNENSDQAQLAADGDPSTVWRTLTYLNNPAFGGLKPGAGMVFDLGREATVANVSLILDNQPNGLQLMIPTEADPASALPPMNTVNEWQVVASDPAAGLQVTLTPDEPVTTRWVMVYFTELPPVGSGLFRSGIAEAYINR